MQDSGTLKWRFDVSTFRLIGRDLITDRVTALFELIKNCYDANATEVTVSFNNVSLKAQEDDKISSICIQDNGVGMSFRDIRDKWMVIGTSSKRTNPYSASPMYRKCVGEKGIGRFAVDKLGDIVDIITKDSDSDNWLNVRIDWSTYFQQSATAAYPKLFTDIENEYHYENANDVTVHGTTLKIQKIREAWVEDDIKRFIKEISKLVSPFASLNFPFVVHVIAPEYNIDEYAIKCIDDVNIASLSFNIGFNKVEDTQETAFYNENESVIEIRNIPMKSFGGVKMKVYYFDDASRRKYRKEYPNNQIDGIKIYRDGIITTPFAESQGDDDKKRDVLGIDKRLWMNIFDRVSTREIIGFVEITREGNPNIIDATNRQDFVDNEEYRSLKEFIITQLDAIESYKKHIRKTKQKESGSSLEEAGKTLSSFIASVENFTNNNPNLKQSFRPFIEQAKKTDKAVKSAIKEKKEAEAEFARKENIYMSIMSLQEYAIHITHAVRTTLNKIRDRVEYFNLFFPDPTEEDIFTRYAHEMYEEFVIVNKVIDYMLSYSQSNIQPEDIDLTNTIQEVFSEYRPQFAANHIITDLVLPERLELSNTRKQFFRDILQNILDNSIKAMNKVSEKKIIRCYVQVENDKLSMSISDTGQGIPLEKRDWVFGLYNTTTQEQGGAGIGLYIVKTRVESLKGTVNVVDSEFGAIGTTIKIVLPFKH